MKYYLTGLLFVLTLSKSIGQELWVGMGVATGGVHTGDFKQEEDKLGALPTLFINYTKNLNPKWAVSLETSYSNMDMSYVNDPESSLKDRGWDLSFKSVEAQLLAKNNLAGSKTFALETGIAFNFLLENTYSEDPNEDGMFDDLIERELDISSTWIGIPLTLRVSSLKLFGEIRDRFSISMGAVFWLTSIQPKDFVVPSKLPPPYFGDTKLLTFGVKVGFRVI